METIDKQFLTAAEAWSWLGISKGFFYKIKKVQKLRTFSVAGSRKCLYSREDLLALVKQKTD
jgi:hypothetical protein